VVDATHPYAERISANAVLAARRAACALLRISRPPWVAEAGDRWIEVASMVDAAAKLGAAGRRVLLTVGRQDLKPFVAAPWHRYVIRSVDAPSPDLTPAGATIIAARGPFALADEIALLREHRIECLVTKNSGGDATRAKLLAARNLGVEVVMVARPEPPADTAATMVKSAADAMAWLARHHAAHSDGGSTALPSRTMP
jgi:precorrin-6A/cobalt-precorrin-6A reductase